MQRSGQSRVQRRAGTKAIRCTKCPGSPLFTGRPAALQKHMKEKHTRTNSK